MGTTGTTLKNMFAWLEDVDCSLPETICDCCILAAEMNAIGSKECLIRIDEFVDRIELSAKALNWKHPKMRKVIKQLVRLAIWKSRKNG